MLKPIFLPRRPSGSPLKSVKISGILHFFMFTNYDPEASFKKLII